jgi:hypothetical protein
MKNQIALIYGFAFVGAAAISFTRGRRGRDLALDTARHGAVAGTALNVVGYLVLGDGTRIPLVARTNGDVANENPKSGMGKTPSKIVALLNSIDSDALFSKLKENGVKVDLAPENPSMINQDPT